LPPQDNEVVRELLTELKINVEKMSARVDQTYDRMERLESSLSKMENAMSGQERRVIILEQNVPANLVSDLALMKDSVETYKKAVWVAMAAIVGAWAKMFFT
jgi:chromosome segregation ATPase